MNICDGEFSLISSSLNSVLIFVIRLSQGGFKHTSHLKSWHAEGENHPYSEISTSFISSFSSLLSFSHLLIQKILLFSYGKSTAILFFPFLKGFWFCYSVWNKWKSHGCVPCSLVIIFQQMVSSIVLNLCRISSYAYILAGFFPEELGVAAKQRCL